MTSLHIRPAEGRDLEALEAIEGEVFRSSRYPFFFLRQALDALQPFFVVAELPGPDVVGYTLGALNAGSRVAWVLSLGVASRAQGHGVGRGLTLALLRRFRQHGADRAYLHVAPSNHRAIRLYEDLGFETVEEHPDYFGPGEDRRILELTPLP